jgi:FAD/FMN-containing dehydrogenase
VHIHPPKGYTTCVTDELISPRSTEELAAAVKRAAATAAAQARRLKIRAARQGCASSQSFTCAVQPSYTPLTVNGTASYAVGLMLDGMNKLLSVDAAKRQLRVQAQMTVRQLLQAANANSLSVPRAALPWWQVRSHVCV